MNLVRAIPKHLVKASQEQRLNKNKKSESLTKFEFSIYGIIRILRKIKQGEDFI